MRPSNDMPTLAERRVDLVVEAPRQSVDKTLIEENLCLISDDRFQQPMEMQRFPEELGRAGQSAESGGRK
jgi:hypothetical protein